MWLMVIFIMRVEHFYKNGGPSWTVWKCNFPKKGEGEVEGISQMVNLVKTDSDRQLGEQ